MSLAEAVLDIANEIEKTSDNPDNYIRSREMKNFVQQLRIAVKTSLGSEKQTWSTVEGSKQEFQLMEKAREEFRAKKQKVAMEELSGQDYAELTGYGNESHPIYAPIDPKMPIGARIFAEGGIWQLKEDRKLHFDSEATKKHFEGRGGK